MDTAKIGPPVTVRHPVFPKIWCDTKTRAKISAFGATLTGCVFPLGAWSFSELRINQKYFRPGARLFLVETTNSKTITPDAETSVDKGLYPAGVGRDFEAMLDGDIDYLPDRSRVIALLGGFDKLTVVHETLHDIYWNGAISLKDRQSFERELLWYYRLTQSPEAPHQHINYKFFTELAAICRRKGLLMKLSPKFYNQAELHNPDYHLFAGECFAYVGELLFDSQNSNFEKVPEDILQLFRHTAPKISQEEA
jgi:hypothetical protein